MRNKLLIVITIVSIFITTGCSSIFHTNENPSAMITQETDTSLVVNHFSGTTTIPKNPKRIVVLDYSVLDNIHSLGINPEAIGTCTQYLPQYIKDMNIQSEIVDVGNLKNVNLEAVYNFHPDLIIINGRQLKYYDKLSKIAPTINTSVMNKSDYKSGLYDSINLIGSIFNAPIVSVALCKEINDRISAINHNPNIKDKGLLLFVVGNKMFVIGPDSMMGGLPYNACQLESILNDDKKDNSKKSTPYADEVSFEYIAAKNPEYIVIINKDAAIHLNSAKTTSFITDNVLLKDTNAVKNGRVYLANSEVWYLAGGGFGSANIMLDEIETILSK